MQSYKDWDHEMFLESLNDAEWSYYLDCQDVGLMVDEFATQLLSTDQPLCEVCEGNGWINVLGSRRVIDVTNLEYGPFWVCEECYQDRPEGIQLYILCPYCHGLIHPSSAEGFCCDEYADGLEDLYGE